MRTGTVGADLLMAVRTLGRLRNAQSIVGTARRRTALRVAAFRIRHSSSLFVDLRLTVSVKRQQNRLITGTNLGSKVSQAAPAVIRGLLMAAAITLVTVLPANRTNSSAGFFTDKLHRQS
jgi:hypothetical protein